MLMNKTCENCGSTVSDQFARVYGDNNDEVHRCMECVDPEEGGRTVLRRGAGAFGDSRI